MTRAEVGGWLLWGLIFLAMNAIILAASLSGWIDGDANLLDWM